MPKPLKFPTKLLIGFTDETIAAIDDWRRKQKDLPTRSEVVRRFVALGLGKPAAATKTAPPKKTHR
jgi:hypothetical protein